MLITIRNWEIYNPKRDQNTYTWLRLQNDIAGAKDLYGLTPEQKWVWVCILCEASKKNSGDVEFELDWLADQTKVQESVIQELLSKLEKKAVISISLPRAAADYTELPLTTPTNERTNERTNVGSSVAVGSTTPAATIVPLLSGLNSPKAKERLGTVPTSVQEAWLAAYEDATWIRQELCKATAWIDANRKKAPKKFAPFMTNWLSNGWEKYRRSLPSSRPADPGSGPRRLPGAALPNPNAKELAEKFVPLVRGQRSTA